MMKELVDLHPKIKIELRMEMGNVSRQQPDQRTDNSRMPLIGLQCSEKFLHPGRASAGPETKMLY